MTTLQKQIRNQVFDLVLAQAGLPAESLYRSPRRDIPAVDLPAILIYSHGDRPVNADDDHQQIHERVYTLRIEIRVAARVEEDATDDLAVKVRRAILTDDSLGQLVNRTQWEQQQWDGVENDIPESGTALDFAFHYFWSPE